MNGKNNVCAMLCMVVSGLCPLSGMADTWNGTDCDTQWNMDGMGRYIVANAAQLAGISQEVTAGNSFEGVSFILTEDIDLDNHDWTPIGYMKKRAGGNITVETKYFSGTFDGGGHTITHCNVNIDNEASYTGLFFNSGRITAGLFGAINNTATLANIIVKNSRFYVKGESYDVYGAVIVGYNNGGRIVNCMAVDNTVTVDAPFTFAIKYGKAYAAGICGYSESDTIENCYAENTISSNGSKTSNSNPIALNSAFTDCYMGDIAASIEALNNNALIQNIVNQANPLYYMWDEELLTLTDVAVVSLDTVPVINGNGSARVYCDEAVERTVGDSTYVTITNKDVVRVECLDTYLAPTRENEGYRLNTCRLYSNGTLWTEEVVSTEPVYTWGISGATGNVSAEFDFIPNYLVSIETNGISDAFVFGELSYVAHENELITIAFTTDTVYEGNKVTRYFIRTVTLNGTDVTDLIVPGSVSTFDFNMPAESVLIYVDFEKDIVSGVCALSRDGIKSYGVEGGIVVETETPYDLVVLSIDGRIVYKNAVNGRSVIRLPKGVYLVNGQKVLVR